MWDRIQRLHQFFWSHDYQCSLILPVIHIITDTKQHACLNALMQWHNRENIHSCCFFLQAIRAMCNLCETGRNNSNKYEVCPPRLIYYNDSHTVWAAMWREKSSAAERPGASYIPAYGWVDRACAVRSSPPINAAAGKRQRSPRLSGTETVRKNTDQTMR